METDMNNYIQNKLDELIETYRKENYSEYDVRMVAERLATDYHNHIVEKFKEKYKFSSSTTLFEILSLLQDTNPKEEEKSYGYKTGYDEEKSFVSEDLGGIIGMNNPKE